MVSLCNDKNGTRRIIFDDATGARHTIRLGKVAKSIAESVRGHIRHLRQSRFFGGTLPGPTAAWVSGIDPEFRKRLEDVGLVDPVATEAPKGEQLGPFLDANKYYSRGGVIIQSGTKLVRDQTVRNLLTFYTADKYLAEIDSASAFAFFQFLMERGGQVESTARKRCSVASSLFAYAVRQGIVATNPFAEVPKSAMAGANASYVSHDDALKILAKLEGTQQQLLFGLGRWGGLRICSEVWGMRWRDIDMVRRRFTVHSPKTKRSKPSREVPIFPELVPLFAARAVEADGMGNPDELVFPILQTYTDTTFRQMVKFAIADAGLKPTRRPWQTMRASRQTDLLRDHPIHVVCAWLGNSTTVAVEHYLRTTDADFEKASGQPAQPARESARKAAPFIRAEGCTENPRKVPKPKKPGKNALGAIPCNPVQRGANGHPSPFRIRFTR